MLYKKEALKMRNTIFRPNFISNDIIKATPVVKQVRKATDPMRGIAGLHFSNLIVYNAKADES